jgi:hypothetical protein
MAPGLPLLPIELDRHATERTERMGQILRCVIWGDDPETRQRLGAGVPGASGRSFQGAAARAAAPKSS